MTKPSWEDAPEWANYLAMDEDGKWYWYEDKPRLLSNAWDLGGKVDVAEFMRGWQDTLEERPK